MLILEEISDQRFRFLVNRYGTNENNADDNAASWGGFPYSKYISWFVQICV